jgi:hypothetical protein
MAAVGLRSGAKTQIKRDEELISGGKNEKGFLGQQTGHSTRPIPGRNEGSNAQAEK